MQKKNIGLMMFVAILFANCFSRQPLQSQYVKGVSASSVSVKNAIGDSTQDAMPMLQTYRQAMQSKMDVIVGTNDVDLKKDKPNGTLGSMVCDAMLAKAQTMEPKCVIAISNYGGLRIGSLPKGNITLGKVYELMPFENTLTIIGLTGAYVDTICQKIAKSGGMPISGMQFALKQGKAINILINQEPIDYVKTYYTCVNSYVASGGDDCEFLIAMNKKNTTALIRDAIIDYIQQRNAAKQSLLQEPIKRIL
jgi:2',3'-cyclic-nucleotide 2'-phosphodiesterase (5'-nucleotidase family)